MIVQCIWERIWESYMESYTVQERMKMVMSNWLSAADTLLVIVDHLPSQIDSQKCQGEGPMDDEV